MAKIKDKKVFTLVVICVTALALFSLHGMINGIISKINNYAIYRSNVALMWEYVADDEEFAQKYGEPVSYEYNFDSQVIYTNLIDDGRQASFYVTVESGTKYLVTVSWECRTDQESVFKYVEVNKNTSLFGS